jgi:hypothetical protein
MPPTDHTHPERPQAIVNVRNMDIETWRRFRAEATLRRQPAGQLLSQVLREWLAKER